MLGKHDIPDASGVMTLITISNKLSRFFPLVTYTVAVEVMVVQSVIRSSTQRMTGI